LQSMQSGLNGDYPIDTAITSAYKVCEQIKEVHPNLDIILLSEHSNVDDRVHGYNAGVSAYLVKPIYMEELSVKLSRLIQSRASLIAS
jgi:DNA-binding response OmpR family regulator